MDMNRRRFLQYSASAVAAASWGAPRIAWGEEASAGTVATAKHVLGQTGIETTFLGMGTGVRAGGNESALHRRGEDTYMEVLEHVYDQGLRYMDMADSYGAHELVRQAMASFMDRDEMMLQTKTFSRDADGALADLERYRQELDTDVIDVLMLHCLTDAGWVDDMQATMDALSEAKAAGHVRALGVSCHDFGALEQAVDSDWVEVILARINPHGSHMDGPVDEVLPLLQRAHDNGKGVIGMKILGEGTLAADHIDECLAYARDLECLDAITIGFLSTDEVDDTMRRLDEA